jgi:hypothetical protein
MQVLDTVKRTSNTYLQTSARTNSPAISPTAIKRTIRTHFPAADNIPAHQ